MYWQQLVSVESRKYDCGFCGSHVASGKGYVAVDEYNEPEATIHICPHCEQPTYFDFRDNQYPGALPGNEVAHLPEEVGDLYQEARNCISANAHTAATLTCRKLLMHIAVEQGAKPGGSFMQYVEYLADNGFVPPNGKGWVDHIRKKGNEATHEIVLMSVEDSVELIAFVEMLLKFIFEFPTRVLGAEGSG